MRSAVCSNYFAKILEQTSEAKKEGEIRQELSLFVANKNLTEYKNCFCM